MWDLQESGAVFTPRRGVFGTPSDTPLVGPALASVRRLLSPHLGDVDIDGFNVAIRRFRDTYERYWPGDPEVLLDSTIVLEALFLGDQNHKELRHRLSLRIARFLSAEVAGRKKLAKTVKELYDMRSKIAHGTTLASLRPAIKRAQARRHRVCLSIGRHCMKSAPIFC